MVEEAEVICVQVVRGLEASNKSHVKVDCTMPQVFFPMFQGADTSVFWRPYAIRAAVLRSGPSIQQGHYTAMLRTAGMAWFADDNQWPQPARPRDIDARQVCLLWLTPQQDDPAQVQAQAPPGRVYTEGGRPQGGKSRSQGFDANLGSIIADFF